MTQETVPGSVAYDDNLRITFVPGGSDPLSKAILEGGTAKDLTYSLKAFNLVTTEEVIDDNRLTLKQKLQKAGKVTQTLEIQYVYGDASDVAKPALVAGTKGFLTARYSTANATAWTATTQKADVLTIECGTQRKDAPVENGVQTITQTLLITAPTQYDQAIKA